MLSPSGRIVPETVQKLQQGIITAMQAKRTTLLKTFQFLNRTGRLRGVAKMEASVAWARLHGTMASALPPRGLKFSQNSNSSSRKA